MKITFLGTADVRPRPDAYCACTMLEIGEDIYLIDAGAPVAELLFKYGKHPKQIKAIFVTHGHSDHFEGIFPLLSQSFFVYRDASYDILFPSKKQADALCECASVVHLDYPFPHDRLRFHIPTEGETAAVYDDGVVKATYIPVSPHEGVPHFSVMIEAEGKTLLFTGDLSDRLKDDDFPKVAYEREIDLVVCEYAHIQAEHLEPCIQKSLAKQFVFNHYAAWRREEIAAFVSDPKYKIPLRAAKDGDVIEL